jgi:hypothetical protein
MSFGLMTVATALCLIGAVAILAAAGRVASVRRVASLPLLRAARITDGQVVRLQGIAEVGPDGTVPDALTEEPCLVNQVSLEWRVGWVREREEHPVEGMPFLLDDGSGLLVEVDPRRALMRCRQRVEEKAELGARRERAAGRTMGGLWGRLPDHVEPEHVVRIVGQRLDPGDQVTVVGRVARCSDHGGSPSWRMGAESEWSPLLLFTERPSSLYGSRWRPLVWGLLCVLVAGGIIAVSCVPGLLGPGE